MSLALPAYMLFPQSVIPPLIISPPLLFRCCRLLFRRLSLLIRDGVARPPDLDSRPSGPFNIILRYRHSADVIILGNLIHDIQHKILNNGAQRLAPVSFFVALSAMAASASSSNCRSTSSSCKKLLILLQDGISGFLQNSDQHLLCQALQSADDGKPSQELGNHAKVP